MLVHPRDPDLYLLTLDDVADADLPPQAAGYGDALRAVADWAHEYLTRPHPDLGRAGPVCPFVPTSLRRRLLFLAVQPGGRDVLDRARVAETIVRYRDWFGELEPREDANAQFKTILVIFPDVAAEDAPDVIDRTQAELKPGFVETGLMIGQFHQLPPSEGGLWNADFRPLRSPVPLLAIRTMVPSDLPFLTGERRLLDGYRRVFGEALPPRQRAELARFLRDVVR